MRKFLIAAVGSVSALTLGLTAPAFAAPNPSGTGQPNQTCQLITAQPGGRTPGNASSSPGSVFNEVNGIGGAAYNNVGAPSQYDVACFQVSQH